MLSSVGISVNVGNNCISCRVRPSLLALLWLTLVGIVLPLIAVLHTEAETGV